MVVFPQRGYRIKPTNNQKIKKRIGQAAARAVAQRVRVAEHTLRRHRVPTYMQGDLAFPATLQRTSKTLRPPSLVIVV